MFLLNEMKRKKKKEKKRNTEQNGHVLEKRIQHLTA